MTVIAVVLRAGSWSSPLAREVPTSDKPIVTDASSAPELSVVLTRSAGRVAAVDDDNRTVD
jgi:hypothetical protein